MSEIAALVFDLSVRFRLGMQLHVALSIARRGEWQTSKVLIPSFAPLKTASKKRHYSLQERCPRFASFEISMRIPRPNMTGSACNAYIPRL